MKNKSSEIFDLLVPVLKTHASNADFKDQHLLPEILEDAVELAGWDKYVATLLGFIKGYHLFDLLMKTIKTGNVTMFQTLQKAKQELKKVIFSKQGTILLKEACITDNAAFVDMLLKLGVSTMHKDLDEQPLMFAKSAEITK